MGLLDLSDAGRAHLDIGELAEALGEGARLLDARAPESSEANVRARALNFSGNLSAFHEAIMVRLKCVLAEPVMFTPSEEKHPL